MVKLYYSEIHSKTSKSSYLSKLYIGKYSEVNDAIKYMQKTKCLLILMAGELLIISHVQVAVL